MSYALVESSTILAPIDASALQPMQCGREGKVGGRIAEQGIDDRFGSLGRRQILQGVFMHRDPLAQRGLFVG